MRYEGGGRSRRGGYRTGGSCGVGEFSQQLPVFMDEIEVGVSAERGKEGIVEEGGVC